jgi:hypothetical protein
VSLIHYAAPLRDADALVQWADTHATTSFGQHTLRDMTLCLWRFDGVAMAPVVVGSTPL